MAGHFCYHIFKKMLEMGFLRIESSSSYKVLLILHKGILNLDSYMMNWLRE